MTSLRSILVLLVASLALSACASSGSSSAPESPAGVFSDRIVVDDLDFPTTGMSVYDLVSRYKGQWLEKRGRKSVNYPVPIRVYLDNPGSPFGGINSLREIRVRSVAFIEHYTGTQAQFKFGMDNSAGAIYVETKTGG